MKFAVMMILAMTLSTACQKKESISDFEAAPNTSADKDGSSAGQGSSSSLGSENPGTPSN